jgi:hypothetical protein
MKIVRSLHADLNCALDLKPKISLGHLFIAMERLSHGIS